MTIRTLLFAAALGLLAAVPAHAGAPAAVAAHFYGYRIKPGMQAKFEAGYRRHLGWHKAHGDRLAWYAWTIEDGPRAGLFVDASMGEPFAAFDRRVDPAGDGADFARTAAPFAEPAFRTTYVLLPEASTATPLEDRRPPAAMQVFRYRLRPGTQARFEGALATLREVLQARGDAPAFSWYRLVGGGAQPQYMLAVARPDWAGYDRFRADLEALLAGHERAAADYAAAVRAVQAETWRYRPALSVFPPR